MIRAALCAITLGRFYPIVCFGVSADKIEMLTNNTLPSQGAWVALDRYFKANFHDPIGIPLLPEYITVRAPCDQKTLSATIPHSGSVFDFYPLVYEGKIASSTKFVICFGNLTVKNNTWSHIYWYNRKINKENMYKCWRLSGVFHSCAKSDSNWHQTFFVAETNSRSNAVPRNIRPDLCFPNSHGFKRIALSFGDSFSGVYGSSSSVIDSRGNADDTCESETNLPPRGQGGIASSIRSAPLVAQVSIIVALGVGAYFLVAIGAGRKSLALRRIWVGAGIGLLIILTFGLAIVASAPGP